MITKPERTKNTSTPTNPPVIRGTPAWKRTTSTMATARRPSTSGRNFRSPGAVPASSPDSRKRLSASAGCVWADTKNLASQWSSPFAHPGVFWPKSRTPAACSRMLKKALHAEIEPSGLKPTQRTTTNLMGAACLYQCGTRNSPV